MCDPANFQQLITYYSLQRPRFLAKRMSSSNEPNCWQRRQQLRHNLLNIQPNDEKDELEQLEMALEVSRKQAELEENQR